MKSARAAVIAWLVSTAVLVSAAHAASPRLAVRDQLSRPLGSGAVESATVSRYVAPPATATLEASAAAIVTEARAWYGEPVAAVTFVALLASRRRVARG